MFQRPMKKTIGTGSGVPGRRSPINHLTIAGQSTTVKYLTLDEVMPSVGLGIFRLQATGAPVSVHYTLADPDLALNPAQSAAIWISHGTVAVGTVADIPIAAAYRITFTGDSVVYVMGA